MHRFPASTLKNFKKEFAIFKKLDKPQKIQDFLNTLHINFEKGGDTCRSPLLALQHKQAQCLEGAMIAAAALWYHGRPPLLLDLRTTKRDSDHVVALFKEGNLWGAISKTNHAVLRYRDPIYRDIRELAMSYFNEYFLDDGKKTLRSFSTKPFSLLEYEDDWLTSSENLWAIHDDLDNAPHTNILAKNGAGKLRLADKIEIETGKIVEWKK